MRPTPYDPSGPPPHRMNDGEEPPRYRNAGMMCLAKVSIWRISSSSDMKP